MSDTNRNKFGYLQKSHSNFILIYFKSFYFIYFQSFFQSNQVKIVLFSPIQIHFERQNLTYLFFTHSMLTSTEAFVLCCIVVVIPRP